MRRIGGLVLALALAGCTASPPSPSPSPAPAPTPTPAVVESDLALAVDGIGVASFGEGPDEVVTAVTERLGEPTADTGWGSSVSAFGTCPGTQLRVVRWSSLFLYFGDGETAYGSAGTAHFFTFMESRFDQRGQPTEPSGLRTAEGIGVGSTVAEAREAFGDRFEVEDDPGFGPRWSAELDGGSFSGVLSRADDMGTISSLMSGALCGE